VDKREDLDALAEEFVPGDEEIRSAIQKEWVTLRERGEGVREGDASRAAFRRWWARYGAEFVAALRRKGI
jgi:hypothetical protein